MLKNVSLANFLIAIKPVTECNSLEDNSAVPVYSTSRATSAAALLGMVKKDAEYSVNWRKNC